MNNGYQSMLIMVILFVAMYFILIRPQNKKDKQEREMRSNLQVGDEVMTVGGVIGRIVRIKEDRVTIATGAEKTKIEFTRNAINQKINADTSKTSKSSDEKDAPKPKKIKKLGQKEEAPAEETPAAEAVQEAPAEAPAEEPAADTAE